MPLSADTKSLAGKDSVYGDMREDRILNYVLANATRNDPDSVIQAMDYFGYNSNEFCMFIGDKKGAIIDDAIRENTPRIAIELGTYCGYSAIRFANLMRKLACDVKYYTFESNPAFARIASQLIEFAGLSDIVKIIEGTFNDKLPGFLNKHPEVKQADFVLIDHIKNRYVPDLKLLEQKRLLARDTVIIADNIKFPGAPEYRDYVLNCSKYYTILYNVSLEYNETIRDVIAISIYQ